MRLSILAALVTTAAAQAQEAPASAVRDAPKADAADASAATDLRSVLADLSRRLGSVRTLRSRFVQTKHLDVFDADVTSEGTLALALPGKLRWEYLTPLRSVLTVDGRRARRERTSRRGVTTRKSFALDDEPVTSIAVAQILLWTRGDFAKARDTYGLALASARPLVIRATPSNEKVRAVVRSIDLTFSDDRTKLTGVALTEANASRTVISFVDVEIDPRLDPALFETGE